METIEIIVVSVLSTLGAIALITSIVVAFRKLKNKVDVSSFEKETDNIYKQVESVNVELHRDLQERAEEYNRRFDELQSCIDSRCDKLFTQIQSLNPKMQVK